MPVAGFIPSGEEFLATIRYPGLEDVVQRNGKTLRFPSAAAAVAFARHEIKRQIAARAPAPDPESEDDAIRRRWKEEQAEEQRRLREAFDMRGVVVVQKKRRFAR